MGSKLTRRQVAERLGIHPRTVNKWVSADRLPPARYRNGAWKRWAAADLDDFEAGRWKPDPKRKQLA